MNLIPGLAAYPFPRVFRVRQRLPMPKVGDVGRSVGQELVKVIGGVIRSGMRVALTAGSRGIADIDLVLRIGAAWVRNHGGDPFVVAAMRLPNSSPVDSFVGVNSLRASGVERCQIGCIPSGQLKARAIIDRPSAPCRRCSCRRLLGGLQICSFHDQT